MEYRKITIDEKSVLKVKTIDVEDFGWDMNGLTAQEYCHKKFRDAIIARVRGALSGGKGIVKHLKSFGRKCFEKISGNS